MVASNLWNNADMSQIGFQVRPLINMGLHINRGG